VRPRADPRGRAPRRRIAADRPLASRRPRCDAGRCRRARGDDPTERRRWQVALSDLIDAILADAIASSALEYPTDHPFWGPFNRSQSRDITAALSSLGYRFDGLGGWVDGRYPPSATCRSRWATPASTRCGCANGRTNAETAELFSDVQVAAAEHLASAAGDMTLGSLVRCLGVAPMA
jgi:hypothetical protein